MAERNITVTSNKTERKVEFARDYGSNLQELVENIGEEVTYTNALSKVVISTQAVVRRILDDPDRTEEEAVEAGMNYVPGAVRVGGGGKKKDALAQLVADVKSGKKSREELLEKINSILAGQDEEAPEEG